jgi:ribosomal protein L35
MKPNKSILKRIKITKTGKLIRRRTGQNHFNAKESGRSQRRKRATLAFPKSFQREILARIS